MLGRNVTANLRPTYHFKMPYLLKTSLHLPRCPFCNIDNPNLTFAGECIPQDANGDKRYWRVYTCKRCAGLVSAVANGFDHDVRFHYPSTQSVSDDIPERPKAYLSQAHLSLSAPSGAVMLAASSVDAMLKAKGLNEGSLYARIEKAADINLITKEMSDWAHEVRLDANDERHADVNASLPDMAQAEKCIEFATALAQFLFVLPARIKRGLDAAK